MNKKAFATYYIMFFILFITILSFVYFNRVNNTGRNIVRDFEKLKAKNLCDLGISASMNIIYKNYTRGNFQFYRSLKYPIKKEYPAGTLYIQNIDIMQNFMLNGKNYSLRFQDIPILDKGIDTGKYDIFEIILKGVSVRGQTVKTKALIKAQKVLRLE
jgi:hypothetical protein